MILIENTVFKKEDYTALSLEVWEYEGCTFINCNFYESPISDTTMRNCTFQNCDLSLVKTPWSTFDTVQFIDCKMVGFRLDLCSAFLLWVSFENCILKYAQFLNLPLKETKFIKCDLQEVDLTGANLSSCVFDECNLFGAIFQRTNLEKADFSSSFNYIIDPENNTIIKAKFSLTWIAGLLTKYDIEIETP